MDEKRNEQHDMKKKVDESWKETVSKEKCGCGGGQDHQHDHGVEASFPLFISSLMMEGVISLGDAEHPVSKKTETNLPHAKFIIDILTMLQEKTKNNLTKDESDMLDSVLYELRMRFLSKSQGKA